MDPAGPDPLTPCVAQFSSPSPWYRDGGQAGAGSWFSDGYEGAMDGHGAEVQRSLAGISSAQPWYRDVGRPGVGPGSVMGKEGR